MNLFTEQLSSNHIIMHKQCPKTKDLITNLKYAKMCSNDTVRCLCRDSLSYDTLWSSGVIELKSRSNSPGEFFSQSWIIEGYLWVGLIIMEDSSLTPSNQLVK